MLFPLLFARASEFSLLLRAVLVRRPAPAMLHPANQSLLFWKILNFAPVPEAASGEADPRVAVGKAACAFPETTHPDVLKVHAAVLDGWYRCGHATRPW